MSEPIVKRTPLSGVLLVAAGVALALLGAMPAGRVFEHGYPVWPTIVACVLCAAVALATFSISSPLWPAMVANFAIVALTGVLAARSVGGGAADAAKAPIDGLRVLLQSRWPAPLEPAATALVAMLSVAAIASTAQLLRTRRFQVAELAPPVVLLGTLAMLGAPAGAPSATLLAAFVVLAIVVLWLSRRVAAPTSAPVAPSTAFGVAAVVLASALIPFATGRGAAADRFDPRANDAVEQVLQELSPLARLEELRSRQPATTLFTATGDTFDRWTLVGLTRFDGQSWMPAGDFRPTGRQLASSQSSSGAPRVVVQLGDLGGHWLPTPGEVVRSSLPVSVDTDRSGLLVPAGLAAGDKVTLDVASHVPDQAQLVTASAGRRTSAVVGTVLPSSIAELASTAVQGATSDFERAQRIEQFLKKDYALDSTGLPGHTLGLLQLFLEQTRRGRDEQFVAAYGLLASAVGLPVRIVVGFVPHPAIGNVTTVTSADVQAWPEVSFGALGWVRFNPVPAVDSPSTGRPASDPAAQTRPAVAQAPPVPRTIPPTNTVAPDEGRPSVSVSSPLPTGVKVGVGAFALVLLVAAYVFGVLTLKQRRRRRLHALERADRRVTGAFLASVDVLVDLGLDAPRSATDAELVGAGRSLLSTGKWRSLDAGGSMAGSQPDATGSFPDRDFEEASNVVGEGEPADAEPADAEPGEPAERLDEGPGVENSNDDPRQLPTLGELADRSTAAVFADEIVTTESADVAWAQMRAFEREMAQSVGPLRWLRSRLSLRSLRRGLTAEPPSS